MKTCPTCGASADVLIVNVVCGTEFCHHCAARECPSFLPRFVLTLDDVHFLRACGIDTQTSGIESFIDGFERVAASDDCEVIRRRKKEG